MIKRLWFVLILLIFMSGYASGLALKDDITITLEEKQIQGLSPTGLSLVFYVNLTNSSSKAYNLAGYNYRFVTNQVEYFRMPHTVMQGLEIPPSKSTLIKLEVKITYERLFNTISDVENMDDVPCYIMGEMSFAQGRRNRGSLPFAFNGDFPIFRAPQVSTTVIRTNVLTIGGADLLFEGQIENPNAFDLDVEYISYDLKFGGHPIETGRIRKDLSVNKHGAESFSIPLLFNFFDVGQDIYGLLMKDTVNCGFSGEIEYRTQWGNITLPFELSNGVEVKKSDADTPLT